ncbi:hypothetical protein JCM10908_006320 [Rhodotorula pacifica]|uniref:uncharacterized protein n=1 Tax=Rhodotorula pacifica TaxID=1495444 RepID=UPI00317F3937
MYDHIHLQGWCKTLKSVHLVSNQRPHRSGLDTVGELIWLKAYLKSAWSLVEATLENFDWSESAADMADTLEDWGMKGLRLRAPGLFMLVEYLTKHWSLLRIRIRTTEESGSAYEVLFTRRDTSGDFELEFPTVMNQPRSFGLL